MNRPTKRNKPSPEISRHQRSSQGKQNRRSTNSRVQQTESFGNNSLIPRRDNLCNGRKSKVNDISQGNEDNEWSLHNPDDVDSHDNTNKNDEENFYSSGDEDENDNIDNNDENPPGLSTDRSIQSTTTMSTRQMQLIQTYSEGNTLKENNNTLRLLTKNLRKYIIPQVKFVTTSKAFGSFEQPDFSDDSCWMNKLFDTIPTMRSATDTMKAAVWMTYRSKLKEQFSLHRSNVTLKIKKKLSQGKNLDPIDYKGVIE